MAEMTIRLRCDPETGKRDIIISLRSDEEALPHEHEQQHRALVEKLIEKGLVPASEIGQIIVEREEDEGEREVGKQEQQPERQSEEQGN